MAVISFSPAQFVAAIPPATRIFTVATILFSLLYYILRWTGGDDFAAPYLVLVPGSSIFYPWTFLTSAFVETTIVELLFTLLVIPASLRYLERLWGAVELLKFIAVSITVSNIIAFGLNWIEYVVLRYPVFLYGQQYHGQMALQIAVLVAFRQIIPEHQVQLFGVLKARVKTLPMAYVTFSTVMCIIGFQCPFIVIQFGWLVSYVWLRFYRKNPGDLSGGPLYGDRSETFAFVTWFPPFIHGPITLLGNTVYSLASKLHLIPSPGGDLESGDMPHYLAVLVLKLKGDGTGVVSRWYLTTLNGSIHSAMALKALDQRLAGGASSPSPLQRPTNGSSIPSRPAATSISNGDSSDSKKAAGEIDVEETGEPSGMEMEDK